MKKTTVNNKEFELGKISVDLYEEYMDIAEKVDKKNRYTRADLEEMAEFVCKAYGDQFTVEELKDPETGLDAAGLILEFQSIDVAVGSDLTKRMEKITENF